MQIDLAKTVAAQAATAFQTVADVMEWPTIIRSISSVEALTPGPIRVGSRLREARIWLGHRAILELEVATMERPHRFRLLAQHPDLHHELDYLIDAVYGGGCRLMLVFRSRPATAAGKTLQPLMSPFMAIALRDELENDLSDLAAAIPRTNTSVS